MYFEVISEISQVRLIAAGVGVRQRRRLFRVYGRGAWRKLKGLAKIKLPDGTQ
jgi:hypothetical protein